MGKHVGKMMEHNDKPDLLWHREGRSTRFSGCYELCATRNLQRSVLQCLELLQLVLRLKYVGCFPFLLKSYTRFA